MKKKTKGYSNFVLKLMLICTILIIGSCVIFSVGSYIHTQLTAQESYWDKLSREEQELVETLYGYVTYGREVQPMYYFMKNNTVTLATFDNLEKMKYAFQLVTEDDIVWLNQDQFTIDGPKYQKLIETIFGENTVYDNSKVFTLYVNQIFNNSIVDISYDPNMDQYLVTKMNGFIPNDDKTFYSKLDDCQVDNDNGIITISEKIIFVDKEYSRDGTTVTKLKIYKDIRREKMITEINNPTANQVNDLSIDDYSRDANVITYTFKRDDNHNYYFYSSVIRE